MPHTVEDVLRSALAAAGYDRGISLSPIPTGRSNHVFKVAASDGYSFIARLSRHQENRFGMEQAVMAVACDAGIPVPDVLDLVRAPLSDQSVLLLSYIDGVPLDRAVERISGGALSDLAAQTGRVLASIHSLSVDGGFGNLNPDLKGQCASLSEWFVDQFEGTIEQVRQHLAGDREALGCIDVIVQYIHDRRNTLLEAAPALLHGDFRPGNILVADGRISGVIDWEAAKSGPPAFDFGWWDWITISSGTPFSSSDLLETYVQHYPIDTAAFDALRHLAVARIAIGNLGWLVRTGDTGGFKTARERFVGMRDNFG